MSLAPRLGVASLPLPPDLRSKLLIAGFRTTADLNLNPFDLSREAQITTEEALEVLKVSTTKYVDGWNQSVLSAAELYEIQSKAQRIVTFCGDLDRVLGGGVCTGQVTEFCGVPGVGKTQLGMQLAVDAQIPQCFGGAGGRAVYIDTEGSFMADRVSEIAEAAVKHIRAAAQQRAHLADRRAEAEAFTVEKCLAGIHYFRIHDNVEQVAMVNMLDRFCASQGVKVVIIDSITFHFRQDIKDMGQRTRVLTQMAQDLMAVAEKHALAVVLMNQVTTKVMEERESKLVPALGESWGHAANTRVILYWRDNERYAHVYKSPCLPPDTALYLVTTDGIRGVKPGPPEKRSAPDAGFG